jgi:hypothetical protein
MVSLSIFFNIVLHTATGVVVTQPLALSVLVLV